MTENEFPKKVSDLMLSLKDYAVVDEGVTIIEALKTLDDAQKKLAEGSYHHRAILVKNKRGLIVGKIGHFAFLEAFLFSEDKAFNDPVLDRAGVSDDMLQTSRQMMKSFQDRLMDDFGMVCRRLQNRKVKDFMRPVSNRIDEDAPLTEAMKLLVKYQTLSLLVTGGKEKTVTGILRIADVFDYFSQFLLNSGCTKDE